MADNQDLVTTITKREKNTAPYPNTTLQSDWDLIKEIYTTYQHLNIANVSFKWIKGHQDTDIPYDKLSIPAQFNVDADRLAEEYLETNFLRSRISPVGPRGKIYATTTKQNNSWSQRQVRHCKN
jgi:hypothetical protein